MVRWGKKRKDGTYCMKEQPQDERRVAAIYFLLGCYTGLRHSDWGRFDLRKHVIVRNGKHYIIGLRTLKNKKLVAMRMHSRLVRLIELIKKHPVAPKYRKASIHLKALAKQLEIDKHITTHVGRKTFAVTICAERGVSCEMCATLMAIHIQTCVKSYYAVTLDKIDNETQTAWNDL